MKELYIDDVLMDIAPDTDISLTIKSNAFSDLKQMASNSSYTIRLPKTTKNEGVLMSVARVQNGGAWARTRHTARYIVDGVPIIEDGLASLLSVGEDFEISISWGIYPKMADIVSDNLTLRGLSSSASLYYGGQNNPEDYTTAMTRGYFFAFYDPFKIERNEQWKYFASLRTPPTIDSIVFTTGAVLTGNVGDTINLMVSSVPGRRCAIVPLWLGCEFWFSQLTGTTEFQSWCIVDELHTVLDVGNDYVNSGIIAPTMSAYLILNTDGNGTASVRRDIDENPTASLSNAGLLFSPMMYTLPCVSVRWLLDQLIADYGIDFDWSGTAKSFIDTLVVPCIDNKTPNPEENVYKFVAHFGVSQSYGLQDVTIDTASPIIYEAASTTTNTLHVSKDCTAIVDVQLIYQEDTSSWSSSSSEYFVGVFPCYVKVSVGQGSQKDEYYVGSGDGRAITLNRNKIDQGIAYHQIAGTGKVDLKSGDEITFDFDTNSMGGVAGLYISGGIVTIRVDLGDEVARGTYFPIVHNLPDIKVVDFLKYLCAVTATFPKQISASGEVAMKDYSTLGDITTSVDWSEKIAVFEFPDEATFTLNDWGRVNRYKYKDDDKTIGNYDGTLILSTATSEQEREVEFPFAASDGNTIPLWSKPQKYGDNQTDNTTGGGAQYATFEGCEPRIMVGKNSEGHIVLTFDGLDMQTIINNKYTAMDASLQDMMIIKVKVALSVVDIHELDETKPIYIRQFASYFALLQLEVNFSGMSTATLMRLKA